MASTSTSISEKGSYRIAIGEKLDRFSLSRLILKYATLSAAAAADTSGVISGDAAVDLTGKLEE